MTLKEEILAGNSEVFCDYVEYKIPTWALCYMVNGDDSGLENDDIAALEQFDRNVFTQFGQGTWDFEEEEYFSHNNDVNDMGGNIVDATYYINK